MTSLNYPTINKGVSQDSFQYTPRDYTLKDPVEYPYAYSRPKATRDVQAWMVPYKDLDDADYRVLWAFWRQVKTAVSFNWTDPTTIQPFTAATTSGSPTVTVSSTSRLVVGQVLAAAGVPANSTITAIGTGNVTISANATATATGVSAQAYNTYEVRFASFDPPEYAGFSDSHLWNVNFTLEEV